MTGWCDYYSWPMDADDTEPCKAYEAISDSENYVPVMVDELIELENKLRADEARKDKEEGVSMRYRPEHRLRREGNNFVYECPKDEDIFGGWMRLERLVRIRLVSKKYDDYDPATDIIWLFETCEVAYERLKACQLILNKNLKIKIGDYGEMTLATDDDQCIRVEININSNKTVKDVIPKVLYILSSKELEWIIWQAISFLQDKAEKQDKINTDYV